MSDDIVIKVENVSKTFKLPHEKNNSIKSAVINFYKRKKSFEKQEALKDVSFEVKKGEFFGIVGRNGSGKSTLLKLLAGIYSPSTGSIQVSGKLTPFIELGVGFNQELSGRENVFLNGALLGFNRKEMNAMYDDIVEFAELERFMDQKLKNYSSGMQVRLAFSIAIRAKSDILLLDEVLAVGDAAFQQKCYNYFEKLKKRKQIVVFVSHDMGAVRRFCTKAIYIKDGVMTDLGTAGDIADIYTVENIEVVSEITTDKKTSPTHRIKSRITTQTESTVAYEVAYESKDKKDNMYVGISVTKDGFSIAEISTSLEQPLKASGTATYTLNTGALNGGIYYLTAALFKLENRELIAYDSHKNQFVIKGSDITKGGAIRLEDTWKYESIRAGS